MAALAVALALGPAASAAPPPPAGRAVALTEPGVVFLRTWVEVAARLTIPDRSKLSRFSSIKKRYASPYATGSGFAVNRNGAIVTASHAVEPSRQDIRNYAANRMYFNSLGGLGYRLGGRSPFGEYHLGATSRVPRQVVTILDGLLQDCYDAAAPDRGAGTATAAPPEEHLPAAGHASVEEHTVIGERHGAEALPVPSAPRFCEECGGHLSPGARFCSRCGHRTT